jgi:hypothetical protein
MKECREEGCHSQPWGKDSRCGVHRYEYEQARRNVRVTQKVYDRAGEYRRWVTDGLFCVDIQTGNMVAFPTEDKAKEFSDYMFRQEGMKSVMVRWGIETDEAKPRPAVVDKPILPWNRNPYDLTELSITLSYDSFESDRPGYDRARSRTRREEAA